MARMLSASEFYAAYMIPGSRGLIIRRWKRMLSKWRESGELVSDESIPTGWYLERRPLHSVASYFYDDAQVCFLIVSYRNSHQLCRLLWRYHGDKISKTVHDHYSKTPASRIEAPNCA